MVAARLDFLSGGHYDELTRALSATVQAVAAPGAIVDIGCGTGHYLAAVLPPGRLGLGLDVSVPAARRAARAHPDVGVVVADCWRPIPVRTGVAAVVLNVFAPRNAQEFARILHPDGRLVVVTPTADHLGELISALGLAGVGVLGVDADKQQRLRHGLADRFTLGESTRVTTPLCLSGGDAAALVGMTPSAHHLDPARLVEALAARTTWETTACVDVSVFGVQAR